MSGALDKISGTLGSIREAINEKFGDDGKTKWERRRKVYASVLYLANGNTGVYGQNVY